MADPPPSKCAFIDWCDNDRASVCNGIGVDGKWYHCRIHKTESQRSSAEACMFLTPGPCLNADNYAMDVAGRRGSWGDLSAQLGNHPRGS